MKLPPPLIFSEKSSPPQAGGEKNPSLLWVLLIVIIGAFLSALLSFQWGVFFLLFAAIAWWAWENPEEGFLLLLITMPILPMFKITQTIATISLVKDVLIGVLFVKMWLLPLLTKHLEYRRNLFIIPIAFLGSWTLVELVRADSLILGVLRARDIGLYALLYFGVLHLKHDTRTLKRRLYWLSASALVAILLGVYQWFFAVDSAVLRFDPAREIWIPRLSSFMAHPSIYGEYLVFIGCLWLALFLLVKRWPWRVGLFAGLIAISALIFLTYSRAVWIGWAAAVGVMGFLFVFLKLRVVAFVETGHAPSLRRNAILISIVLLTLFLLFVRFTPAGVFLRSVFDPTYGSNAERLEFLVRLIGPLENHEALFGKGLGDVLEQNFREVDVEVIDIAEGSTRTVQLTKNRTLVDNQYLKTFIEMGLAGILIYTWVYWVLLTSSFRISLFKDDLSNIVGLTSLGFAVAFVVQALFIDIWDIFPTNAIFWIIAAHTSAKNRA